MQVNSVTQQSQETPADAILALLGGAVVETPTQTAGQTGSESFAVLLAGQQALVDSDTQTTASQQTALDASAQAKISPQIVLDAGAQTASEQVKATVASSDAAQTPGPDKVDVSDAQTASDDDRVMVVVEPDLNALVGAALLNPPQLFVAKAQAESVTDGAVPEKPTDEAVSANAAMTGARESYGSLVTETQLAPVPLGQVSKTASSSKEEKANAVAGTLVQADEPVESKSQASSAASVEQARTAEPGQTVPSMGTNAASGASDEPATPEKLEVGQAPKMTDGSVAPEEGTKPVGAQGVTSASRATYTVGNEPAASVVGKAFGTARIVSDGSPIVAMATAVVATEDDAIPTGSATPKAQVDDVDTDETNADEVKGTSDLESPEVPAGKPGVSAESVAKAKSAGNGDTSASYKSPGGKSDGVVADVSKASSVPVNSLATSVHVTQDTKAIEKPQEAAAQSVESRGTALPAASSGTTAARETTVATEVQTSTTERVTLKDVGNHVVRSVRYLDERGEQSIKIRLVPASLGEVQVEVTSNHDAVTVKLVSSSPAVREALTNQASGLKDTLIREGIQVTNVNVTGDASGQSAFGNAGRSPGSWTPQDRTPSWTGSLTRQFGGDTSDSPKRNAAQHNGALNVYV